MDKLIIGPIVLLKAMLVAALITGVVDFGAYLIGKPK